MRKIVLILLFLLLFHTVYSIGKNTQSDTQWFKEARFGMFIHFGPYSVLGAGEWVMHNRNIKGENYKRLLDFFNPEEFNAREIVQLAKNAGMKYITFTSRHHDSFSNWNTNQSDWNIMNTHYGKDLLKELADECHKEDIKLVLYYSILDWMKSEYQYETGRTGKGTGRTEKSDWDSYLNFMKGQLTELLTNYGPIAGIWLDGHWDQTEDENRTSHETHVDWHYPEIYGLIKSIQPDCLIANNHHLSPFDGEDYQIFERDVPGENKAGYSGQDVSALPLETCQTINDTWGFNINDDNYKPTKELLHLLIRTAGMGANLLLNVGPMPNGKIQQECIDRLNQMGEWTSQYGYTIYGTKGGFIPPQAWGAITQKDNIIYIHVLDNTAREIDITLPKIKSAELINSSDPLRWKKDRKTGNVKFTFMEGELDEIDSIIEVKLK